jgi:thioredoxin-related protein
MNHLIINFAFALLLCINRQGFSQGDQYVVQNHSYEQVFDFANKENKHVLLFFYFDGCSACTNMEKNIFSDSSVIDYLNKEFLFCKINVLKDEGIAINKIYKTFSYPTNIICDANVTLLGKNIGYLKKDEFLLFCKRSVNSKTSLAEMKEMYNTGNRSADFLFDYCLELGRAIELDSIPINEYLSTQKPEKLRSKKNIQFIYTYAITYTKANIAISSPAFELLHSQKELFYQQYDTTQVKGRVVWIAEQNFQDAIIKEDFQKMQKCLMILSDYVSDNYYRVNDVNGVYKSVIFYTKNDHLSNNIIYQSLIGDEIKYNELIRIFMIENINNPEALNGMAWTFVQNVTDKQKLKDAVVWIEQAIVINDNYAYNDTFAWLLFKEEKYKQALEIAEKAIHLAKANNEDYNGTIQLIQKIKTVLE